MCAMLDAMDAFRLKKAQELRDRGVATVRGKSSTAVVRS